MAKKEREGPDPNAWMATYSDMVTLLLCFFVLLFSMSTLDAVKWKILVKGFNPDAEETSQVILNQDVVDAPANALAEGGSALLSQDAGETMSESQQASNEVEQAVQQSLEQMLENMKDMSDLAEYIEEYIAEEGLQDQIKVFEGDDYVYIMFSNNIFFGGDSSVLRNEGKAILDTFGGAMDRVSDMISKIQVVGHTNQADPNKPNSVPGDRYLSSNRATEVLIYLQEKNIVEPKVLESVGYGQFYPIGSFTDEEGRARNRRVELIIKQNSDDESINLDSIYSDIAAAQAAGRVEGTIVDANVIAS